MATKRKYNLADRRLIGLVCGIVAGISYGTNPLFAKPLMDSGVPVLVMLFFRYGISAFLLAAWMLVKKEKFRVRGRDLSDSAVNGSNPGDAKTSEFVDGYLPRKKKGPKSH